MIVDLAVDELAGELQAGRGIGGVAELFDAQEDVLQGVTPGESLEIAASGEVGERDVFVAQSVNGLGRDLDVSKEGDVGDIHDADFVHDSVLLFNLEHSVGAANAHAVGI